MIRGAVIIFLVNCCAFLCSQTPAESRKFDAFKKNVPLAIINTHATYFHLLRYNKEVHDFTLERRDKLTAEMLNFNPFKLDLVNADWFNYENLDYLFFENNHKICFVFEKRTNFRSEIYLKMVDTLGNSSDFIQLAVLDKEKSIESINFKFSVTKDRKILLIGTQNYITGITKKVALLYDPEKLQNVWIKKLPLETPETGVSWGFECSERGDLFYGLLRPRIVSFKRKYIDHKQQDVPVYAHDIKALICFPKEQNQALKTQLSVTTPHQVYGLTMFADSAGVLVLLHYSAFSATGEEKVFFLTERWNTNLNRLFYKVVTPLNETVQNQLTYYDATDFNSPSDKDFTVVDHFVNAGSAYVLTEHKDENVYKELLLLKIDPLTGALLTQQLIPRKIIYYKGRWRYKNLTSSIQLFCADSYQNILFENARNALKQPAEYKYRKFSKAGTLKGGNIVSYNLRKDGSIEKNVLFKNEDYEYVPLPTQSRNCELIMYTTNGVFEKFVTVKLNP